MALYSFSRFFDRKLPTLFAENWWCSVIRRQKVTNFIYFQRFRPPEFSALQRGKVTDFIFIPQFGSCSPYKILWLPDISPSLFLPVHFALTGIISFPPPVN